MESGPGLVLIAQACFAKETSGILAYDELLDAFFRAPDSEKRIA